MDSVGMIFMTMCVTLWSDGSENCGYLYTQAPEHQLYDMWQSAGGYDIKHLGGFTTSEDRKIYMKQGYSAMDIGHEAKHALCNIEYEKADGKNHPNCTGHFFVIDLSKYA